MRKVFSEHSYIVYDDVTAALCCLDNHCIMFQPTVEFFRLSAAEISLNATHNLYQLFAPNLRHPHFEIRDNQVHAVVQSNIWTYHCYHAMFASWQDMADSLNSILVEMMDTTTQEYQATCQVLKSEPFMRINYLKELPGHTELLPRYFREYHGIYHCFSYSDEARDKAVKKFLASVNAEDSFYG